MLVLMCGSGSWGGEEAWILLVLGSVHVHLVDVFSYTRVLQCALQEKG